ncbi:MAG: hypothetical protein HY897_04845 [Deltaproteobacteria bacterium]|nr:hypothetical protein [Deltaproteobacteria bacterium]
MKNVILSLFLAPLALLAACAPIRCDPVTGIVTKEGVSYRTGVPGPEWRVAKVGDNDAALFNPRTLSTIAANGACGVRGDAPLRVLLNHLLFGFSDRKVVSEEIVTLDGREALKAVMTARLDGIPRRFLVYIVKKDWCVYDLQYQAPESAFDAGLPAFETFVGGFKTK